MTDKGGIMSEVAIAPIVRMSGSQQSFQARHPVDPACAGLRT